MNSNSQHKTAWSDTASSPPPNYICIPAPAPKGEYGNPSSRKTKGPGPWGLEGTFQNWQAPMEDGTQEGKRGPHRPFPTLAGGEGRRGQGWEWEAISGS